MSTRKGKEEENVEQRKKRFSNKRRKNENTSFNFYLQVLKVFIIQMQK